MKGIAWIFCFGENNFYPTITVLVLKKKKQNVFNCYAIQNIIDFSLKMEQQQFYRIMVDENSLKQLNLENCVIVNEDGTFNQQSVNIQTKISYVCKM